MTNFFISIKFIQMSPQWRQPYSKLQPPAQAPDSLYPTLLFFDNF